MKESPYMMVLHGVLIGVIVYAILRYGLGNAHNVSEMRAIITALATSMYMIIFGHKLPF